MAETVKKATAKPKAPAKPRKTAATKTSTNGAASNVTEMPIVPHDQVAMLAHQLWIERGHQHGSDADDWFRAEQMLRNKAS
jgi:Protein of unknown function (DUF2934)